MSEGSFISRITEAIANESEERDASGRDLVEDVDFKDAGSDNASEFADSLSAKNVDTANISKSETIGIYDDLIVAPEEQLEEFEDYEDEVFSDAGLSSLSNIVTEEIEELEEEIEEELEEEERSATGISGISTPSISGRYRVEEDGRTNMARAATLSPFSHLWAIGCNTASGMVGCSLSEPPREVAYAASNLGILLNCDDKSIHRLPGHQNMITSIACDKKGKWIVTVDSGPNSCLIIWYRKKRIPVHTKFASESAGFGRVAMSSCGKIYAVVCLGPAPYLLLVEWTQPKETECIIYLPLGFGAVEKFCFSDNPSNYVMILTSKIKVAFISYNYMDYSIEMPPPLNQKSDSNVGPFTDSTFLKVCTRAATATKLGYILLWFRSNLGKVELHSFFHLNPDPVNIIKYHNGLVATGDQGGIVCFYDDKFRLKFSTHGLEMGSIVALDFDHAMLSPPPPENKEEEKSLSEEDVGDFVVTTEGGRIIMVNLLEKKITDLIEPLPNKKIISLHCCPTIDMMCVAIEDNQLRVYDLTTLQLAYSSCLLCPVGDVTPSPVTIVRFSSVGEYLCCCQEDGTVRTLHARSLSSIDQVAEGDKPIDTIGFSENSMYLATIDVDYTLWLYLVSKSRSLTLIGKVKYIHSDKVVCLYFSKERPVRITTIGADRRIVVHRLEKRKDSMFEVIVKETDYRIEQFALPTCAVKHPTLADHLILANSMYKYRVLNLKKYIYSKTCLAPAIKNCKPICQMESLPEYDMFVFITGKMAGIQKLPLDGNPYKNISMLLCGTNIAHYGFAFSRYCIVTNGEDDNTIHMWKIKPEIVELVEVLGGVGLQPYYSLLEGGEAGVIMKDIKDFFIYCQILHEGHAINYPREVGHTIRACELVTLFRALGYFPSEYEIRNLYNEIGISARTDLYKTLIEFETFVKLFVNHRPYGGVNKTQLSRAFRTFCAKRGDSKSHSVPRDHFISFLTEHGDCWRGGEFSSVVMRLAGRGCDEHAPNAAATPGAHIATVPGPPTEDMSVDDLAGGDDDSHASSQTQHQMQQALYNELLPNDINFEFLYYDLLGMKRGRHRREPLLSGTSKFSLSKIRKSKQASTVKKVSFASGKIAPPAAINKK